MSELREISTDELKPLRAFNNNKVFQAQMIAAAISHREKDEYIAGAYAKVNGSFKGCSVGCSLFDVKGIKGVDVGEEYNDLALLAKELGIPEFICHLQDSIFEGLPESERLRWTERLFNSIPLGADLTPVLPRFLLKTLDRLPETNRADVVDAIRGVKDVLINWSETGEADIEAARSAAGSAARSAARSARSAEGPARSAAWEQIANDLIECVEGAAA